MDYYSWLCAWCPLWRTPNPPKARSNWNWAAPEPTALISTALAPSANGSFGYYFNDVVELSIRQSAAYNDIGGVGWNASTRVSIDWNFPLGDTGAFTPFIGVNGGYAYGTHGLHNWEAAPEAGLKYYINGSTFIFGSIEYQFFVDQHSSNTNTFSNRLSKGEFIYGLGIGVRF